MNRKGQILVEYVLLLVIAVLVSSLLVRQLISRSEDDTGIIISKWHSILKVIGEDKPDQAK